MPPSHRIVYTATNETTRQGISELAQQKQQEAEWQRVRSQFREPTLGDYRTTIVVHNPNSTATSTGIGTRASDISASITTVEVFEGPKWLQALKEKKEAALQSKVPMVKADLTSTLDELVKATTLQPLTTSSRVHDSNALGDMNNTATMNNTTSLSRVSLSAISPLQTRNTNASTASSTTASAPPLLDEEVCAWKRCLWLQQQHQRQYGGSLDAEGNRLQSGEGTFLKNCAWLRSLDAVKGEFSTAATE